MDGSTVLLGCTKPGDYDGPGTITGSTFNTTGSGVIKASESVLLNGITNHRTIDVVAIPGVYGGSVAILENTINNTGTITTVGGNIQLSGPVSLTGGGGGATPEPATCFLIGAGLPVGIYRWRAKRPIR